MSSNLSYFKKGGNVMSTTKDEEVDHIYYNVIIPNTDTTKKQITFTENRTQAILSKANEWYLSIVRFAIPTTTLPIFNFPNNTTYSVTLSFGGTDTQQYLLYTNETAVTDSSNPVFSIQHMVDMVNTALSSAFTTLGLAVVLPVTVTEAPYMQYDADTGLLSIVAQKTYDPVTLTPTVAVYFNQPLALLLNTFYLFNIVIPGQEVSGKFAQLRIEDTKNNTFDATHYIMTQETTNVQSWTNISSYRFITTTIPTRSELIPSSNGVNNQSLIMQDFQPDTPERPENNNILEFSALGPYHLVDLTSTNELNTMNVSVYVVYKDGTSAAVYLNPKETFSCKIMFRKKSLGI